MGAAPQSMDVFTALGWILVFVIAGVVVIYMVRRWLRAESAPPVGFTLADLREMRDGGEITDSEFEAAKSAMIAQVKRQSSAAKAREGRPAEVRRVH